MSMLSLSWIFLIIPSQCLSFDTNKTKPFVLFDLYVCVCVSYSVIFLCMCFWMDCIESEIWGRLQKKIYEKNEVWIMENWLLACWIDDKMCSVRAVVAKVFLLSKRINCSRTYFLQPYFIVVWQVIYVHNQKDKCIYPKGFGLAWEQAHFTSRGHWETNFIAGTIIFKFVCHKNEELTDDCRSSWPMLFLTHQILNVEKNRLTSLPPSIGELRLLQTLNLKGMMQTAGYLWGRECSHGVKSLVFSPINLCVNRKLSLRTANFDWFSEQPANLRCQWQQHCPAAPTVGLHPYSWGMCLILTAVPSGAAMFNRFFVCDHRLWHLMRPWWPIHLHLCVLRVQRASSNSSALVRLSSSSQVTYDLHSNFTSLDDEDDL